MDAEGSGSGSVIAQCRRANSFAPARPDVEAHSRPLPFKRAPTIVGMGNPAGEEAVSSFMAPVLQSARREKNGESSTAGSSNIFTGMKFLALGEAKSASVRSAVELNGGTWCAGGDDEDEVDYVIVRLVRCVSSFFLFLNSVVECFLFLVEAKCTGKSMTRPFV